MYLSNLLSDGMSQEVTIEDLITTIMQTQDSVQLEKEKEVRK